MQLKFSNFQAYVLLSFLYFENKIIEKLSED